jgi:hypothetical protein
MWTPLFNIGITLRKWGLSWNEDDGLNKNKQREKGFFFFDLFDFFVLSIPAGEMVCGVNY